MNFKNYNRILSNFRPLKYVHPLDFFHIFREAIPNAWTSYASNCTGYSYVPGTYFPPAGAAYHIPVWGIITDYPYLFKKNRRKKLNMFQQKQEKKLNQTIQPSAKIQERVPFWEKTTREIKKRDKQRGKKLQEIKTWRKTTLKREKIRKSGYL